MLRDEAALVNIVEYQSLYDYFCKEGLNLLNKGRIRAKERTKRRIFTTWMRSQGYSTIRMSKMRTIKRKLSVIGYSLTQKI